MNPHKRARFYRLLPWALALPLAIVALHVLSVLLSAGDDVGDWSAMMRYLLFSPSTLVPFYLLGVLSAWLYLRDRDEATLERIVFFSPFAFMAIAMPWLLVFYRFLSDSADSPLEPPTLLFFVGHSLILGMLYGGPAQLLLISCRKAEEQ